MTSPTQITAPAHTAPRPDPGRYAHRGDLTTGPILSHLRRMSLPMVWGIFAIISFQLANMFYISRLGTEYLAAISFTLPITFIVHNLSIAMSIATSSILARQIGAGNQMRVRRLTTHVLMAGFLVGGLMSVVGILTINPVFRAMGADDAMLAIIRDYLLIWFSGSMLLTVPMVGNAALRAAGDSVFPATVMTVAALVNVILDPILIFGLFGAPALGVKGAAIANVFAYFCTLAAGLYVLYAHKKMIAWRFVRLRLFGDSLKRFFTIALPVGLTMCLQPLTNSIFIALLAIYGHQAVAAFGIVSRVEAFLFIPIMALATGMAPVIGQNWGAKLYGRVRDTLKLAIAFCFIWSALVALVLALFGPYLASLFADSDMQVVRVAALYFWIVMPSLIAGNLLQGWASAYNAMGMPKQAFIMIFVRMIVLSIPLGWAGSALFGLYGLLGGFALANIISGLGAHYYSMRKLKRAECSQNANP